MITASTPKAVLADLLEPVWREEPVETTKTYSLLGARWYAKGLYVKDVKPGSAIQADTLYRVRAGDFVYNRLFAWKGSFAVAEAEHDECYVSNEFPCFVPIDDRVNPRFLLYYLSRETSWNEALGMSTGGTPLSRNRLKEDLFLSLRIPLPDRRDQDRIVATLDGAAARLADAQRLCREIDEARDALLRSAFHQITDGAPRVPMSEAAPLVRRPVDVKMGGEYRELGIRSFGKGTFHKPALDYLAVGDKKLYYIEPGDLLFNNVFAWEGAIAVAQPEDEGRVGSHRFITCIANHEAATADYLAFYFLTPEGMEAIGKASPGGAGRNRTLGLDKLMVIPVPVPSIEKQYWFGRLQAKLNESRVETRRVATETEALMPSILDRAFRGDL